MSLERKKPLGRDLEKARQFERRGRGRLRQVGKRRKKQLPARQKLIDEVIARYGGCVAEGIDGVPHGTIAGRKPLEVNELKRGASRSSTWLDPDWCIPLCPAAHDWVTVEGYPEPARELGLAAHSSEADAEAVHARRRAAGGR